MQDSIRGRIYYGWLLVGATFVTVLISGGLGFYTFSVFMKPLQSAFGWSRASLSGAVALWAVVYGITGPLVGVGMERFGARRTMAAAAFLGGLGYVLLSRVSSLLLLHSAMVLSGVCVAGTTLVPGQTLVSHWFKRLRGRAMGLMMVGIGVGGLVMPPLVNFLIERITWRGAFGFGCAALWLVVLPLIIVFVRSKPSELGLLPDGSVAEEQTVSPTAPTVTGLPVRRAITSAAFGLLFAVYVLHLFGQSVLTVHFVPFADDAGLAAQQAANFWGLTLGFSVGGRLLFGWLADRSNPRSLMAFSGVLFAAGVAILEICFVRLDTVSTVPLVFFAVIYGCGVGASATILPMLVGQCFGLLNFSKIIGLVMSGFAVGVVFGPTSAGKIFDTTGSYELAFVLCIAAFLISCGLVLMIRPERLQREFETAARS